MSEGNLLHIGKVSTVTNSVLDSTVTEEVVSPVVVVAVVMGSVFSSSVPRLLFLRGGVDICIR